MKAFLDTHAAIFLAEGKVRLFGKASTRLLETAEVYISPMVRLELACLHEAGKINSDPDVVLGYLGVEHGIVMLNDGIDDVVTSAMRLGWCRDPFDRLLVATALLHDAPFISRDQRIRAHYAKTVW